MNIHQLLELEEGYRAKAYYCSEMYPTIGIGTKIGPKGSNLRHYDFTVSRDVAMALLEDELKGIYKALDKLEWFNSLSDDRKTIIESMCYQLGVSGVMKFKKNDSGIKCW